MLADLVAPWYYLKLEGLLKERKYAEAWDEIERWAVFYARLYNIISEGKHWIAVAKALIEVSGLHTGPPRPPQSPLTRAQYEMIGNLIKKTGILSKV